MKKIFIIITLFFAGISLFQSHANASSVKANAEQAEDSITVQAQKVTQSMTKRYDLNEEQAQAVMMLNIKREKAFAAIMKDFDAANSTEAQRKEIKIKKLAEQKRYDAILKELLSDKQYERYQTDELRKQAEADANDGDNKISEWGPRVVGGENIVNLLGWGALMSDSTKIATRETEKMVKKYKLDEKQAEKLLALNTAEVLAEIIERKEMTKGDMNLEKTKALSEAAQERSDRYHQYLKTIFNEEQYKKYMNMRKAQDARRQNFGHRHW